MPNISMVCIYWRFYQTRKSNGALDHCKIFRFLRFVVVLIYQAKPNWNLSLVPILTASNIILLDVQRTNPMLWMSESMQESPVVYLSLLLGKRYWVRLLWTWSQLWLLCFTRYSAIGASFQRIWSSFTLLMMDWRFNGVTTMVVGSVCMCEYEWHKASILVPQTPLLE